MFPLFTSIKDAVLLLSYPPTAAPRWGQVGPCEDKRVLQEHFKHFDLALTAWNGMGQTQDKSERRAKEIKRETTYSIDVF